MNHAVSLLLVIAACLLPAANSAFALEARLHIWTRAFIPSTHEGRPGLIKRTAIGTAVVSAPDFIGQLAGTCFETDNRGFDAALDASVRIGLEFVLVIRDRDMTVEAPPGRNTARVGETHNVDCVTGNAIQRSKSAPSEPLKIHPVKKDNFKRTLFVEAAGANPFYPSVKVPFLDMYLGLSPDIDYRISFTYDFIARKITYKGTAGYFPSFEGYYSLNGGAARPMYQLSPYEDSTPWSLPDLGTGLNTRNFAGFISLK